MLKGAGYPMQFSIDRGRDLLSRKIVVAAILGVALLAFEIFNFDTTQFALTNLLGEISFAGILWATILAIAFCAIDFAGLVRLFTPQRNAEEPRAVWFLTGAWFLGTIANSILTWWAVSLTLLSHEFGNEVLSRETLLRYVPIFVAMLVWLTRILFIGAFSVAGEKALDASREASPGLPVAVTQRELPTAVQAGSTANARQPVRAADQKRAPAQARSKPQSRPAAQPSTSQATVTYEPLDDTFDVEPAAPKTSNGNGTARPVSRIQQRPPMPGGMGRTPATGGMHASSSKSSH